MTDIWIIVENKYQADAARSLLIEKPNLKVLSTSAEAYWYSMSRSLPVKGIHTYLSYGQLNRRAIANAEIVEMLGSALSQAFENQVKDALGGFRPFEVMTYQIKQVMDSVSFRYSELDHFFEKERPSEIFFWDSAGSETGHGKNGLSGHSRPILLDYVEPVTTNLLKQNFAKRNRHTKLIGLPPLGCARSKKKIKRSVFKRVLERSLNKNLIYLLKRFGVKKFGLESKSFPRITVLGSLDEINRFVEDAILRNNVNIDLWQNWEDDPIALRTGCNVRSSRAVVSGVLDQWDKTFISQLIDRAWEVLEGKMPSGVSRLLRSGLIRFSEKRIPVLLSLYSRATEYFGDRGILAAFCGTISGDSIGTITQAAKQSGVKVVCFQHGGVYGYAHLPLIIYSDLKFSEMFCTYADKVTETLRQQAREYRLTVKTVTIGRSIRSRGGSGDSTRKHRIRKKPGKPMREISGKPVLLYVATGLVGNGRYGPYHWYDDTAYFLHQCELADSLAEESELEVIFKLHYKDNVNSPILEYVADQGFETIQVVSGGRLVNLLPNADIVIIDWPSTTLLETLEMHKDIIYIDLGILKWVTGARRLLEETVQWIDKEVGWQGKVSASIKKISEGTLCRADNRFLEVYGSREYRPDRLWEVLRHVNLQAMEGQ